MLLLPAPLGPITAVSDSSQSSRNIVGRLDAAERFAELPDFEHGYSFATRSPFRASSPMQAAPMPLRRRSRH